MLDVTAKPPAIKETPEYKALLKQYADPEWRLDNLYFIRDGEGNRIKFKRNEGQSHFCANMALRNVLPKSRKIGFSTLIGILICDQCVFRKGHVAGIVDLTIKDAQDKLAIILFAYMNLPEMVRLGNRLVRDNDEYLEWE